MTGKREIKEQSPNETKKRAKKGDKKRDFVCKCGKDFQSYPALYTHVKNKHEMKLGEFYQKKVDIVQDQTRRGRPEKYVLCSKNDQEEISKKHDENFLILLYSDDKFNKLLTEFMANHKEKILDTNVERISKEQYLEVLEIIKNLTNLSDSDLKVYEFLKANAKEDHLNFVGTASEFYGEKIWKLLMLHSLFRTFLRKDYFQQMIHLSIERFQNKSLEEIKSSVLTNTHSKQEEFIQLAYEISDFVFLKNFNIQDTAS